MYKCTTCKRQKQCRLRTRPSVDEFAQEEAGGGRKLGRARKAATKRELGLPPPPATGEPRSQSGRALNRVAAKRECEVKVPESSLPGALAELGGGGFGGAALAEAAPLGHALN